MNNNELNEDSNSISMGFVPLEMKTSRPRRFQKKSSENLQERLRQLDHRLMISITIVTPIQVQIHTFREQLKNFRFEKKSKPIGFTNEGLGNEERQVQQLFSTLKDVFYHWRQKINQKFFIAFGNGDLAYFFHKPIVEDIKKGTKNGGSFALLSCKRSTFSLIFNEFKIPYEQLERSNYQGERLLVKNSAIQLYWKCLVSLLMEKPANFEIVSSFYFMNAMEILPVEVYNGKEQRPQYDHVAQTKNNILGEEERELYSMKIEGFWTKDNLDKLFGKLEQICERKPFEIDFDCHPGTENFQYQCEQL